MDEKTPRIAIMIGNKKKLLHTGRLVSLCCLCGELRDLSERSLSGSAMMRQGAAITLLPGGIETLLLLRLCACRLCWDRIDKGKALILQG